LLPKLNLPEYSFTFRAARSGSQRTQIFDTIRKKYVALTPEEWVRQNFIQYLANEKKFPLSLMAIEMGMKYNQLQKRGDVVVYDMSGRPWLIVECKAPAVKITQEAFDQVARYNMSLKVKYVVVTNGMNHFCCEIDHEGMSYRFVKEVPEWEG
jgi:type I site-specific restriction endonuclease